MIPRLRDELDLSYFDPQFTQEVTPVETPVEESGMRASVTGGLFDGFTYDQTAAEAARLHGDGDGDLGGLEDDDLGDDGGGGGGGDGASLEAPPAIGGGLAAVDDEL